MFLARALLQDADVALLDETFSALDPETLSRTLPKVLELAPNAGSDRSCVNESRQRDSWPDVVNAGILPPPVFPDSRSTTHDHSAAIIDRLGHEAVARQY